MTRDTAKPKPKRQQVHIRREDATVKGNWTPVPGDAVFGKRAAELSPVARLVYIAVRFFARTREVCWPDDRTLATYVGIPESQVPGALGELQAGRLLRMQLSKGGTSRKLFVEPIPKAFTAAFQELREAGTTATSTRTRARSASGSTSRSTNFKGLEATVPGAESSETQRPSTADVLDVQVVDVNAPAPGEEASAGRLNGADGDGAQVGEADELEHEEQPEPKEPSQQLGLTGEQQREALGRYGPMLFAQALDVLAADPDPAGTAKLWFARGRGHELSAEELSEEINRRAKLNGVCISGAPKTAEAVR